jgi:hypothetical protein
MKRTGIAVLALAGALLVTAASAPPDSRLALARIVIFGASLVVALHVIRRVAPAAASAPDVFDVELETPAEPAEVAGLRRIEFDAQMATVHPFGIVWLQPLLRELANGRLLGNRGIDMERDPEAARHALGEPLWRLVGPDSGQWTAGAMRLSPAQIEAAADRLEQI